VVYRPGLRIRSTRDERQSVQFRRAPFLVAGILAHWPVCPVSVEVVTRPEANEDIRNLGSTALKLEVLMHLRKLEDDPFLSRPLQDFPDTGDLSDCRKVYIGDRTYRIVYRLLPDEHRPTKIDVITVGPREASEVYLEAISRLGRMPARTS
jgi:mRNA-degrading endonuclease RelE of RelBE toxin-antitoxin system